MTTVRRCLRLLLAVAALGGPAQGQPATVVETAPRETVDAYRLLFHSIETPTGLEVVTIPADSPVLDMTSAEQASMHGIMELGDVVSAVDGQPIRRFADYFAAMEASAANDGRVTLTVLDRVTKRPHQWRVAARRVKVPVGGGAGSAKRQAHFLLIGLTDDGRIGPAMNDTLGLWQHPVNAIDADRRGSVRIVKGSECRAEAILRAVADLDVAARDTLFCVYCGHGAFDPARATPDDPSRGHHFQIRPAGDLWRKDLSTALLAKGARLTVLISDTCNIMDAARPAVVTEEKTRTVTVMGMTPFEQLLFNYRGVIDLSGTNFGQFGYCQPGLGSWYSVSAVPVLELHADWQNAYDQMRRLVDNDFQSRRTQYGIAQAHLTPVAFRFEVVRDEPTSPLVMSAPPEMKTVEFRERVAVGP